MNLKKNFPGKQDSEDEYNTNKVYFLNSSGELRITDMGWW